MTMTTTPTSFDDTWVDLGEQDEVLGNKDCKSVLVNNVAIGLFRVDGELHAIDDVCTHGVALLTEGECDGYEVECPLHGGVVDIRTGKPICSPIVKPTRVHQVALQGKRIMLKVVQ
jgi:naphthalene 1,2-dioxygenase system ferredoxin subunit